MLRRFHAISYSLINDAALPTLPNLQAKHRLRNPQQSRRRKKTEAERMRSRRIRLRRIPRSDEPLLAQASRCPNFGDHLLKAPDRNHVSSRSQTCTLTSTTFYMITVACPYNKCVRNGIFALLHIHPPCPIIKLFLLPFE